MFNDGALVRSLLEYGADIDVQDKFGWTIVHLVARNGNGAVIRLLLEYRAVNVKIGKGM